jgi:hypothetical protein
MTASRDFAGVISLCESEEVAGEIVRLSDRMNDTELRAILKDEWDRCDAHRAHREQLVRLFRRAGYVSDNKRTLKGELVIFRGDISGEGAPRGISWTRSLKVARKFADYCVSPRARYVGIYKEGGAPIGAPRSRPAKSLAISPSGTKRK